MRGLLLVSLVLGLPVAEGFALASLARSWGWWLLVYLAAAAIAGVLLLRLERVVFGLRIVWAMQRGGSPIRALLGAAKTVIAGILLIFPGVITDVLAVLVLLIPVPKHVVDSPPPGTGPGAYPGTGPGSSDGAIEGEFRREDRPREQLPPR